MLIADDRELTPGRLKNTVVTVGNFDGVHVGHQKLMEIARDHASKIGGPLVAYTFDPHPLKFLNPTACPPTLTGFDEKAYFLEGLGVDIVVRAAFDAEYAQKPPQWFAEDELCEKLGASEVWVGEDFAFGKGRTGNIATLEEAGSRLGYKVNVLEPVEVHGIRVSSTRIRQAIKEGDFVTAHELLGRPYAVTGEVVRGVGRGRTIGFPTANIDRGDLCIPDEGVYSAFAFVDGVRYRAAVNIGDNPTFGGGPLTLEAFIIGESRDFYSRDMSIVFVRKIRGEITFTSAETLIEQIKKDVETIDRELLELCR